MKRMKGRVVTSMMGVWLLAAPIQGFAGQIITTADLADLAVTTPKLADGSVTAAKIGAAAVGTGALEDGSVTTGKIADSSVTNPKIADGSVNTQKVSDGAVTEQKLADGAVTTAKIGAAAVGTAALADGSVTISKIVDGSVTNPKIADYSINTQKVSDGAVTEQKLADGAVTDAKISGTISGTKLGSHNHAISEISGVVPANQLPVGTTVGTVAAGNHSHAALKNYANVIVVAKSGGDFTDPVAAMNSISDASAANPYLMKIMPGVYDIGQMWVKDYVDIQGAGKNNTHLRGRDLGAYSPLLNISGYNEIRGVSVEVTCDDTQYTICLATQFLTGKGLIEDSFISVHSYAGNGIRVYGTELTVKNVDIKVDNASPLGGGGLDGIFLDGNSTPPKVTVTNTNITTSANSYNTGIRLSRYSDVVLDNVRIRGLGPAGEGIADYAGFVIKATLNNVDIDVPGNALVMNANPLNVFNSRIKGTVAIYGSNAKMVNTQLIGAYSGISKTLNCFDGNFNAIP